MKQDGYSNVVGVDVVPRAIDFCHQRDLNATIQNVQDLSFDDSVFDAVFCRHTLEHTINPKKALKELARVVKPNGVVFVVIPIESGKPKLRKRRKIKFGHSHVFEDDSVFLRLLDDLPYKLIGRFHDETIKYIASIFVLRRKQDVN
jgi:ubiquinone/menaquinone biosynthesis C-methylase UbiE